MSVTSWFVLAPLATLFCLFLRLYFVLPPSRTRQARKRTEPCHTAVFLGSGGHTSEALMLMSALDFSRYSPRTYIISEGDSLSAQKAIDLENRKDLVRLSLTHRAPDKSYTILTIPRARRVHQSIITTPPTALWSLLACVYHVTIVPFLSRSSHGPIFADVLILNGPGTCFVLCLAVYLNKCFGLPSPKLIYVESFARVRSLSLSGKLLRPLVDRFVVQWPTILNDGGRGDYRGWLV
ncbi:glycosyltransferase family 1 protein [Jaapia argillacea MUCL 33604]|uniref:UDP-N-acetylglucosamine transferase subunit ALG14 n=1 Tax=Jaapia argillacea MUCL 33604 TaxID=933084 RepID=A0A067PUG9_9AGAM|nr:glycosyltransferase family 1 protein [Jaapia argillacea MUCL 33604]